MGGDMKICVVGAGAIGGLMAAKLSLAGEDVTVVDQGAHLAAIQADGLKLVWHDGSLLHARDIKAAASLEDAGPQDLVILALKAHYLEAVARQMPALTGPDTAILTVQNGIPWWYFHKHGGPFDGHRLDSLDPTGLLQKHIDGDRIVGCVVYPAAEVTEPGVIRHVEGDRFPLGELDGETSQRAKTLCTLLKGAGFRSRVIDDIRSEICALTQATLVDICQFGETRALAAAMMGEAQAIAEQLGVSFRHTIEKRIAGAEQVGAHKTSMLQDVQAGRSLEVEALLGAVLEIGALTATPAPAIQAVYACVKLLNKTILMQGTGISPSAVA